MFIKRTLGINNAWEEVSNSKMEHLDCWCEELKQDVGYNPRKMHISLLPSKISEYYPKISKVFLRALHYGFLPHFKSPIIQGTPLHISLRISYGDSLGMIGCSLKDWEQIRNGHLGFTAYLPVTCSGEQLIGIVKMARELDSLLVDAPLGNEVFFTPNDIPITPHLYVRCTAREGKIEYLSADSPLLAETTELYKKSEEYKFFCKSFPEYDQFRKKNLPQVFGSLSSKKEEKKPLYTPFFTKSSYPDSKLVFPKTNPSRLYRPVLESKEGKIESKRECAIKF